VKARNAITNRVAAAAVFAAALFSASIPASAQTDEERAGARAAATEGAAAMEQQRWADAIDLFTRAESLVHAPPHLLYLARAYEKQGKLVKARETYAKLTRETLPANAPAAFTNAQAEGTTELAALEPRVPSLRISIKGGAVPDLVVTMDGNPVPPALVGVPRPVDPGRHEIQATGKGVASEVATVTLKEGVKEILEIELKPVAGGVPTPPVATGPTPATSATPSPEAIPPGKDSGPPASKSNPLRTVSYITLGGGVVALAIGGIFAAKSHSKRVEGDDLCPGGACKVSDKDTLDSLDSDATSAGRIAYTGFLLGGAAVATGVTLYFLSAGKQEPKRAARNTPAISPWVGLGSAGVVGRF